MSRQALIYWGSPQKLVRLRPKSNPLNQQTYVHYKSRIDPHPYPMFPAVFWPKVHLLSFGSWIAPPWFPWAPWRRVAVCGTSNTLRWACWAPGKMRWWRCGRWRTFPQLWQEGGQPDTVWGGRGLFIESSAITKIKDGMVIWCYAAMPMLEIYKSKKPGEIMNNHDFKPIRKESGFQQPLFSHLVVESLSLVPARWWNTRDAGALQLGAQGHRNGDVRSKAGPGRGLLRRHRDLGEVDGLEQTHQVAKQKNWICWEVFIEYSWSISMVS